ncbi:MAG: S49 family peptidase [Hyphomonadaceae bacterium]|nr:S49 family peptidase [Hyphomonadaceae bacterium]
MKQFLITVAGVLVGFVLCVFVGVALIGASIGSAAQRHADSQPGASVLGVDLRQDLTDAPANSPFNFNGSTSVVELVRKLDAAAKDNKVKGLYVRANTFGLAPAHAEEVRDAIARFRASGKWVIAHMQNEGIRTSIAGYAAVAGADEVWLHDASELLPMGITAEQTFFADTLRRFKLTAQFETREEFKSAADTITQSGYTPANREATTSLLTSIYERMIASIAESRKAQGMTAQTVREAIEATPYTGEEALRRKLVDKLGRPEDAMLAALERAGGVDNAGVVDVADYTPRPPSGPVIALVTGEGEIVSGPAENNPFGDSQVMNGDVIAESILDAARDKDVKAIVFRVSSPGGSVVGSDQIWHAVETAQARGKKVVVSMGAYAASGGYYVSAGADEIVAWPTTITGSIGVVGGKVILGDALEHYLSARTDTVQVGSPTANYFTSSRPFTNQESAAFAGFIDRAYTDFIALVAEGRGMTPEQVREVAKGRVWTGAQAHERKLVNTLGGLNVAIDRAKALAGIKAETGVQLRLYPQEKSPFEALEELFGVSAANARTAATLAAILGDERVAGALRAVMDDRQGVRAETHIDVR